MLKTDIPTLLMLACVTTGSAIFADDTTEPPLSYTLEVDGLKFLITADKTVILKGNFQNPKVTLRASSTRRFEHVGIAFDYPANFTFEADVSEPGIRSWTMSGNNVTLMLFDFEQPVKPAELIASTAESLETNVDRMEPTTIKLGSLNAEGQSALLKVGEVALTYSVVALPAAEGKSRLLIVQDLPQENGQPSDEKTAILKTLDDSFTQSP